jgi:flagellar motor protein MotB
MIILNCLLHLNLIKAIMVASLIAVATVELHAQGSAFQALGSGEESLPLIKKINPGPAVNSRLEETKPVVSADGHRLYFARKNSRVNMGGAEDPQDIYFSELKQETNWSYSRNLGHRINTTSADNLCAVLDSNTFIFFVPTDKHRGRFVVRTTDMKRRVFVGPTVFNESDYLEACFSFDGNVVFYTAKTKDNVNYRQDIDERDIYMSVRKYIGWSTPVNLGSIINSAGDEFSPFLAADGRTLYFATNGRGGFGSADIFVSRRIGDEWSNWTTPVNLGASINSAHFDGYLTMSGNPGIAYLVSYDHSLGKSDIIIAQVPEELCPNIVHGKDSLSLHSILFERGTAKLKPLSEQVLDSILIIMQNKPGMTIELQGHTDNMGSLKGLKTLSERRVATVRDHLIKSGIGPSRITGKAFGGLKPKIENSTESNRAQNRRVELILRNPTNTSL